MIPGRSEKEALYSGARERLEGLLAGEPDGVARMAGLAAVLHEAMPHYFWTGFYRVVGARLVVGPYQGPPACGEIHWGRGVCGAAWRSGEVQVVADVHAFPGHIACDPRSASEIVVPLRRDGRVVAVFDVDSEAPGAFDEADVAGLASILPRVLA